jgi:hypothetical protein
VLLATFSTQWVPAWKPALLALAGIAGVVCCGMYAGMSDVALVEMFNRRMPKGMTLERIVPDYHMLGYGFYIAVGCGVALLVLAAVQFRAVIFRPPSVPAAPEDSTPVG